MIENFIQQVMAGDKDAIVIVICAYFALACGWSLIGQMRVRRWPSTAGQLISHGVKQFGASAMHVSDQEFVNTARYVYTVDGQEYESTRVSPWVILASHNLKRVLETQLRDVSVLPDGGVEVFYNPRKPHKAYLIKPGIFGMSMTVAMGALPFIYYL